MKKLKVIGGILSILVIICVIFQNSPKKVSASVVQGSEYHATTTNPLGFVNYSVLQTGYGTLGSVVITGVSTGTFTLYDASTTVNGGIYGTTTLASFPANAATSTYTFDIIFTKGLLLDWKGNVGTTTITFR